MMDIIALSDMFVRSLTLHLVICVSLWFLLLAAILIDLWDRIYTQRKTGRAIVSNRLRLTTDKVSEYGRFMLIAFIIDAVVFIICTLLGRDGLPVASILFAFGLLIIECKSLFEHARERKSKLVDMSAVLKIIVNAATDKDAKEAIRQIGDYIENNKEVKKV